MDSFKSSLAYWASIAGTMISLLGIIQSYPWLITVGVIIVIGSVVTILYARKTHQRLLLAEFKVEGRSIDSLNVASLRRRLNRSLVVQEAYQLAKIYKEHLSITWHYAGYCRADQEASIDFSIDTDNNIPFDKLDCFAYDLQNDPKRKHKIRPILIGPDGISKKVRVPFLKRLTAHQPFAVRLGCKLPGCMKSGIEYYTSTTSFDQDKIPHCAVRLIFFHDRPNWLRVYERGTSGRATLIKDLRPLRETSEISEYFDVADDMPGRSARIYIFQRLHT